MAKRNSKRKRIRLNKLRFSLTIVLVILFIIFGMSVKNILDLKQEQKSLKAMNASLKDKKERLEKELKQVNDKNYIEEQARLQLKLIKPGETLYILDEEEQDE